MNASVEDIEKDPPTYLDRLREGETVVVFEKDRPVAEMRPLVKREGKRPRGLAKGDFVVPDDFDDPLPENGEVMPTLETIFKLAAAIGCQPTDLLSPFNGIDLGTLLDQ